MLFRFPEGALRASIQSDMDGCIGHLEELAPAIVCDQDIYGEDPVSYTHLDVYKRQVQAIGNVHINVKEQNIDMLSLSGHKIHASKGVGALYLRSGVSIENFMDGGAQERGLSLIHISPGRRGQWPCPFPP